MLVLVDAFDLGGPSGLQCFMYPPKPRSLLKSPGGPETFKHGSELSTPGASADFALPFSSLSIQLSNALLEPSCIPVALSFMVVYSLRCPSVRYL